MKIAEVTPVFPPYKGGIGTVCRQNAEMLASAGHEVTVFTPYYPSLRASAPQKEVRQRVVIERIVPMVHFGNAGVMPQLLTKLRDFDVIHLHYPCIGGAEFAIRAAQRYGIPLVTTYHMDLIGERSWKKPVFELYTRKNLPRMVETSMHVLVTSHDYATHSLLAPYIAENPAKYIEMPCSVDTGLFKPAQKNHARMKGLGIDPSDSVVLFVGGLDDAHYFKGITYLLEAWRTLVQREGEALARTKLVIVGEGNRKASYQAQAQVWGLDECVVFASAPNVGELIEHYNMADCLILPAIDSSEAFGIVLIEAMACGKPVIASRLPGVRSVVEEGQSGLLAEPKNTHDLASHILTLLKNHAQREAMGWRSLARAREHYSDLVVAARLTEVMTSLGMRKL